MRGDLSTTGIADLCRGLADAESTGALEVEGPEGVSRVFFRHGAVYWAVSPAPRAQLGSRLVSAGFLSQEELRGALDAQETGAERVKLGAIVVERGLVTTDVIRVFVQEQILDALFDLFSWRDGSFRFHTGDAVTERLPVDMPVAQLLVEVSRRQSEWDTIIEAIPSLDMVPDFVTSGNTAAASLEPDEFSVLASVDGQRSIRDIASDLGYSEFEAARIVYGLQLLGIIAMRDSVDGEIVGGRAKPDVSASREPAEALTDDEMPSMRTPSAAPAPQAAPEDAPADAPAAAPEPLGDFDDVGAALDAAISDLSAEPDPPPPVGDFDLDGLEGVADEDPDEPEPWVFDAGQPAAAAPPAPPAPPPPPSVTASPPPPPAPGPASGASSDEDLDGVLAASATELEDALAAFETPGSEASDFDDIGDLSDFDDLPDIAPPASPAAAPNPASVFAQMRDINDSNTPPPAEVADEPDDEPDDRGDHLDDDAPRPAATAPPAPAGDVSSFLRELSSIAVDAPEQPAPPADPDAPKPPPVPPPPPKREDPKDKKKKGLFGWGG